MKKHLLILILALAASVVQAQNGDFYSLLYHNMEGHYYNVHEIMQQQDNDIIINTHLIETGGNNVGCVLFKISPGTVTITDTLFVADTNPDYYTNFFINQDPNGEGNIRAKLEYHEDCDSTFVRISRFPDSDLHINPDDDIVVPLCDGIAYRASSLVDCGGDLIMEYGKERPNMAYFYDYYIARVGLDGTLKSQASLADICLLSAQRIRTLKESPLTYYQYGWPELSNNNVAVYLIDSLFQTSTVVLSNILSEVAIDPYHYLRERLNVNYDTDVIPIGGDDILVAAEYQMDTSSHPMTAEYGVAVAKYNLRTMQLKDYVAFNDYPGYYHEAHCLGIKMMSDGTVYFMYRESGYPDESVIIVKMDTDLNVEWKRFCKTDNVRIFDPAVNEYSVLFKDGQGEEKGVAWMGECRVLDNNCHGFVIFLLNHEGPVGLEKYGVEVRPYMFCPNPARDQLRFQYSPDVQPKQVELHDLQGRQVHTQNGNFENVDLSRLPAGIYTLRVTMEDGKTYSDKVVKE